MKKLLTFLIIIAVTVVAVMLYNPNLFDDGKNTPPEKSTPGLVYTLNDSGYYEVSVGTAVNESEIIIPSAHKGVEVRYVAEEGFKGCTALVTLTISGSSINVNYGAFENCTSLTTVNASAFPWLSANAFKGCTSLKSISLSATESIGEHAFDGCVSLEDVGALNQVKTIHEYAFFGCENLKSIDLGTRMTTVWSYAFFGCKSLSEITFPDTNHLIGEYAFSECTGLKTVSFGSALVDINEGAFSGCTGITAVSIPDSVTLIRKNAFMGCSSIKTLEIGRGVESIYNGAFSDCTVLESIYYNAECAEDAGANNNIFLNAGSASDGIELIIGKAVSTIPTHMFSPTSKKEGSPKITSLNFERDAVCTTIGDEAFAYIDSLEEAAIAHSVRRINRDAFSYCSSLKTIYIPAGIESIDSSTFTDCTALTSVLFGGTDEEWKAAYADQFEIASENPIKNANVYFNRTIDFSYSK